MSMNIFYHNIVLIVSYYKLIKSNVTRGISAYELLLIVRRWITVVQWEVGLKTILQIQQT